MRTVGFTLLVLIAVVCLGPVSAAADESTTLCVVNAEEGCKAEDFAGEAFTATSTETSLDFGELGVVNCSSTMVRSEAGQLIALSFTGCSSGCAVKAENLPYNTDLIKPSSGNGRLNILNAGAEPRIAVLCGATECRYSNWFVEADVTGGEPAAVLVSLAMPELTKGFFCPKTAQWEGVYELTAPSSAVYVVKKAFEGPMFCLKNVEVCPQSAIADALWAELQPKTSFRVIKLIGGAVNCATTGFLLHDVVNKFSPGPWRQKTFPIAECTHPIYSGCTLKREPVANFGYLFPLGGGNGEVGIAAGESEEEPALRIECIAEEEPFECLYSTEEFWLEFEGGEQATMEEIGSMARLEGPPAFCPASVLVRGDYRVSETSGGGTQLYLTET